MNEETIQSIKDAIKIAVDAAVADAFSVEGPANSLTAQQKKLIIGESLTIDDYFQLLQDFPGV